MNQILTPLNEEINMSDVIEIFTGDEDEPEVQAPPVQAEDTSAIDLEAAKLRSAKRRRQQLLQTSREQRGVDSLGGQGARESGTKRLLGS